MEIEKITDEKIEQIVSLLKMYVPNWAEVISGKMTLRKEWKDAGKKPCKVNTVYNMAGKKIKSQFNRRVFAMCAGELILKSAQENNKVVEKVNEIIGEQAK